MDPEQWQRLKALFGDALVRTGPERSDLLEEVGDPELRKELASLLAAHEGADGVLGGEDRIGPYQLLEEIGRGGMGTVYRALRMDEAFRKEVAIKVIRPGMDSDFVVSRFCAERQILATLVHPNIAALLDGGTAAGLPYFVMEYVDGQPIDDYCDEHRLPVAARLELFLAVCDAVQHAHGRLIVHRDLKPGNVLVTSAGVPKLLDFGIAKLLEPTGVSAEQTAAPFRFVTPAFASPEQLRGKSITTASDVYSLGALLFVLLTGRRVFTPTGESQEELIRAVCEDEPPKPSAIAKDPGVARRLAGDLDTIVLKTLRKDPAERYPSVEKLADDLRRHLEGLPVQAVPGRFAYRARKFVRRHGAGLLVAFLIALLATGAFVEIVRQRARAERRFKDVRRLANSFLFELHDAIRDLPGSMPARELVIKRAKEYLASLAEEASGDVDLERELASAYLKLGELQGTGAASMGDLPGALASFRSELALREAILAAAPDDPESARLLARALDDVGFVRLRLRDEAGLEDVLRALAMREGLLARQPPALSALRDVARSHNSLANMYSERGDHRRALEHRKEEVALAEKLAAAEPSRPQVRRSLAFASRWLALELVMTGEPEKARPVVERSVAIDQARLDENPTDALAKLDLAYDHYVLARVLSRSGDVDGALENGGRAVREAREIVAADPKNATARDALAWGHRIIGITLRDAHQPERARDAFIEAAHAVEDMLKTGQVPSWRDSLAWVYSELGDLCVDLARAASGTERTARWREALDWLRKSQTLYEGLAKESRETEDGARNRQGIVKLIAVCEDALAHDGEPSEPGPAPAPAGINE